MGGRQFFESILPYLLRKTYSSMTGGETLEAPTSDSFSFIHSLNKSFLGTHFALGIIDTEMKAQYLLQEEFESSRKLDYKSENELHCAAMMTILSQKRSPTIVKYIHISKIREYA